LVEKIEREGRIMNILGTGLSGLVGSRVVELLPEHTFENLSLETGVDITNKDQVKSYFEKSDASWVFHFAAYTNVQEAEKQQELKEKSIAWKINVEATETIIANCKLYKKKLLYVDTDYAFDGTKKEYTEIDVPNPLGWYAKTKFEGAKRALALGKESLVIRIANPYRAHPVGKTDFVHKMLERLMNGQEIIAPKDQIFVPTYVDDIAYAIQKLVSHHADGLYHVVGSTALSPFAAANEIADVFGCDAKNIHATSFHEMFHDRAPAPQYANLKNDKITSLGVVMKSFHDGLVEVKSLEGTPKENKNVIK
jgi:dTDP-4-dehydrorhamnose reductase